MPWTVILSILGTLGIRETVVYALSRKTTKAGIAKTNAETSKVGMEIRKAETDIFTSALDAAGELITQLKSSNNFLNAAMAARDARITELEVGFRQMEKTVATSEAHRTKCETELAEIRQKLGMK